MVQSEKQKSMDNIEIDEEFNETPSSMEDASSSSSCSGIGENNVFQFLQALDLQVVGACRVDERLKPLLKLNVSTGAAEDRLLAHLNQNFEPSEVGMLARCLCIPLVSMRVGKIRKQGTLLCPTTTRDDGMTEIVGIYCGESECAAVEVKDIAADNSGRSFLINIPDGETFYFWCSEKSKLLGDELRRKMRDWLKKKPSLAELTGIDDSRLDCFASHLRAYLLGSAATNSRTCSVLARDPSADGSVDSSELGLSSQISVASQKPQHLSGLESKTNYLSCVDSQIAGTSSSIDAPSSTFSDKDIFGRETSPNILEPLLSFPPFRGPAPTIPSLDSAISSPYYCWCPPTVSALQYSVGTPHLPILSTDSMPLLPSIPPAYPSSILTPMPPLVTDISSLDFPPLLPLSLTTSQQISSFTPLMCDPIVHIPVIDVCSSGQGYLVSAGPAISSTIPPLLPNLVNQETESSVEKSARETLRLLLNSSSQPSPQLIDLLPPVLTRSEEGQNMMATGSRGLYAGTIDVGTIANGFAIKGLASLSERPVGLANKKQISIENLVFPMERKGGISGESSFDEGCIDSEEETK